MTLTIAGWIFTIILISIALILSIFISIKTQSFEAFLIVSGICLSIAIVLWGIVIGVSCPRELSQVSKEIVSIKQDRKTSGQFFLGTGHIEDKPTYIMYAKEGNDTYKLLEVYTDNYYIVETDNITPNITYRGFGESWICTHYLTPQESYGTIYVPKGTIKVKFQL